MSRLVPLLSAVLLLAPASGAVLVVAAPSQLAKTQRQAIMETIRPSLGAVEKFAATTPPAKNLGELQSQLTALLNGGDVEALYEAANAKLDQLAKVGDLRSAQGVPNFDEVVRGVYRSATPTLSQVESLVEAKTIDHVISLNPELKMLAKMDPGSTSPLTPNRRKAILEKLAARGKTDARADGLLKLYEDHLTYAQAVYQKSRKDLDAFPLDGPDETIEEYFAALERLVELRRERKNVLLHCNIGKHRTGLISMLIKALERGGAPEGEELSELYLEFVERNWNVKAQTRIHYMISFPIIARSAPFRQMALKWQAASS